MVSIILASKSPNRKEILKNLGIEFSVVEPIFDESSIKEDDPINLTNILARKKAESVFNTYGNRNSSKLILSADTVIFAGGMIFGKPENKFQAKKMLEIYSDSIHQVITSICCINTLTHSIMEKTSVSNVHFKKMSEKDLQTCLAAGDWKNAAGGYKIQGTAGFFIKKIEGSYTGIVGLPASELYEILSLQGII